MLTAALGGSAIDLGKSIAIVVLAVLLGAALCQASTGRSQAVRDDQARAAARDVARRFAVALTTYDYAHLEVQLAQVERLSSATVVQRIRSAQDDVGVAQASSIGEVESDHVAMQSRLSARVLVETKQVISNSYPKAAQLKGMLDVTVAAGRDGWTVAEYRWLAVPTQVP
jgi:hypothetical protein